MRDAPIDFDYYSVKNVVRPWDSLDAMLPPGKIHTCDNQRQVSRCLDCPLKECHGSEECWYRRELEEPKREVKVSIWAGVSVEKEPKGYDEARLNHVMTYAYLEKDIAAALGLSLYMTKKWLAWRYR